jgi:hypothetical protein
MATVIFRDETATGRPIAALEIGGVPQRASVRELIRIRVREEVARHNAAPGSRFHGLVRPTEAEVELNGYRLSEPRVLDWQAQARIAERAFESNGFFVLVDERQVESLDEVVQVGAELSLVFIKLVPLVGG